MARVYRDSAYGKTPIKSRQVITRDMNNTTASTISAVDVNNTVLYVAHREGDNRERRQAAQLVSSTSITYHASGREYPWNAGNALQTVTIIEYDR